MKEEKEIRSHVEALGKWAAEDGNRVAFVVCGEITEDGVETSNSLVGRADRIAQALFRNAMRNESQKQVIELASEMIKHPLLGMMLGMAAHEERGSEKKNDVPKDLDDLFEVIKRILLKND